MVLPRNDASGGFAGAIEGAQGPAQTVTVGMRPKRGRKDRSLAASRSEARWQGMRRAGSRAKLFQQGGGGGLFDAALGALAARGGAVAIVSVTVISNSGAWSGPSRSVTSYFGGVMPLACAHSCKAVLASRASSSTLSRREDHSCSTTFCAVVKSASR